MARLCKVIFCLMAVLLLVDSVICQDADPPSNVPGPQSPADSDASAPPPPPSDLSGVPASPPKPSDLSSPPGPPLPTNAPAPSLPKHSPGPSPSAPSASDTPKSPTPGPSPSDVGAADDKKSPAPSPDADMKHLSDSEIGEKSKDSSSSGGMSGVKKLGISVGVILFVGVIAAGVILYKKRQANIARSRYAYAAGGTFL